MFRRVISASQPEQQATDRINSVLGPGIIWKGDLQGSGGIRIEGNFEGEIHLQGMLVIGETGKISGKCFSANTMIIAGMINGDIVAEKLEIRSTGRVWGNVRVVAMATEDGAFLKGQVTMEDQIDLNSFRQNHVPQESSPSPAQPVEVTPSKSIRNKPPRKPPSKKIA